jgi:hypothetical protein
MKNDELKMKNDELRRNFEHGMPNIPIPEISPARNQPLLLI